MYLAQDPGSGRKVSLKVMSATEAGAGRVGLEREAGAIKRCPVPGVPVLYESGEIHGRPYLACRYVEGSDLRQVLGQGKRGPEETVRVGAQLVTILRSCHARGVVHGDVKPENLILDPEGRVHLSDFGLAVAEGLPLPGPGSGTPRYLAPEQRQGAGASPATDLYQAGLVVAECWTGHPATSRDRAADRPLVPDGLPGWLAEALGELLAVEPARRMAGAEALLAGLPGAGPVVRVEARDRSDAAHRSSGGMRRVALAVRPEAGPTPPTLPEPSPETLDAVAPGGLDFPGCWPLGATWALGFAHAHLLYDLIGRSGPWLAVTLGSAAAVQAITLLGLGLGMSVRVRAFCLALGWGMAVGALASFVAAGHGSPLLVAVGLVPFLIGFVASMIGCLWVVGVPAPSRLAEPEIYEPVALEALAPGLGFSRLGQSDALWILLPAAVACAALAQFGLGFVLGGVVYSLGLASVLTTALERAQHAQAEEVRLLVDLGVGSEAGARCQAGMAALSARLAACIRAGRWKPPHLDGRRRSWPEARDPARPRRAPLVGAAAKEFAAKIPEVEACFVAGRLHVLAVGQGNHLYCDRHDLCATPLPTVVDREAATCCDASGTGSIGRVAPTREASASSSA